MAYGAYRTYVRPPPFPINRTGVRLRSLAQEREGVAPRTEKSLTVVESLADTAGELGHGSLVDKETKDRNSDTPLP